MSVCAGATTYVNDDKTVSQLLGTLNRVEAQNKLFVKNKVFRVNPPAG